MGALMGGQGQQQQGPPRPQQRGPQGPNQMGPPAPGPPPPQQQGPPGPPKESYFQKNRGAIGDALFAMGTSMLGQQTSTMPTSFGQAVGQGASKGGLAFQASRKRRQQEIDDEDTRRRQKVLEDRATKTFGQQQEEHAYKTGRRGVTDQQQDETYDFNSGRRDILANQQDKRFQWDSTGTDQRNVTFDQGLKDSAEESRRGVVDWNYKQEVRKRDEVMRDGLKNMELAGLNPEQQAIYRMAGQGASADTLLQYGMSAAKGPEAVDMMTTDMKNAQFAAFAENPDGTPEEHRTRAAEIVLNKMNKPQTAIDLGSKPGREMNQQYAKEQQQRYESSRNTLNLLKNFDMAMQPDEQGRTVNSGYWGENVLKSASAAYQTVQLLGLEDTFSKDDINNAFETNIDKATLMNSIGSRLALEMTNQLAGQISEKELQFAVNAMPGLINTEEGNKMMIAVLSENARHEMARTEYMESHRKDDASLPGKIKGMMAKWDKDNEQFLREGGEADGAITEYGQRMIDAGVFQLKPQNVLDAAEAARKAAEAAGLPSDFVID